MPRTRVTITNVADRREQLRVASRIRTQAVEALRPRLDPENPLNGVHRNRDGQPYFEFNADDFDAVRRFLADHDAGHGIVVTEATERLGEACVNCGNVAGPTLPTVCPNCGFRDIDPCPICGNEVSRRDYRRSGPIFTCPTAINGHYHHVRLTFNEPLFERDGSFRQPLVIVSPAED
ncbi:hypothetical protein OJF2_43370 [Aquisphaera giovannonii]|uniref:Uncharacterized protein n=1 Tax=Aquisphaera giovannonii TaxID=406548 RepID=A0A5B9W770_9BACT|nr:hypothetical protein [Aquisphaera giovannonii]QEH35780.1 hypothetical protein OJF2_43370 [Aquisphaera giovannonii]